MKQFRTPYFFRWIFHQRIWGFSRKQNTVYITFDDGPTETCTAWILDILAEKKIKATFFCVGSNVQKRPELLQRILSEGHSIGNHTMRHEKGTNTNKHTYISSVDKASKLIPSDLFRPPYGRIPMAYTRHLRKKYRIVMWTWLSYDYDPAVTTETILTRARSIKAGDILVLHDNQKSFEKLRVVLPELLKILEQKGLCCAPISA